VTSSDELPYAAEAGGVRLSVRLTPGASRQRLDGVVNGADGRSALQLRVAAPPVEGAANAALIAILSNALGVRTSAVHIRAGHTARLKRLFIAAESVGLLARLADWVARGGG
jgi:uncharacterized protein (TIGR00251 family)